MGLNYFAAFFFLFIVSSIISDKILIKEAKEYRAVMHCNGSISMRGPGIRSIN